MSWGLEWLGLGLDADVRAVKRAYAQRLRQTRPDEDADAFQLLHEAYQDALAWVETDPGAEGAPAVSLAHSRHPANDNEQSAAPPVDVQAVADRIAAHAVRLDPAALQRWLKAQPELWSLNDKPDIGWAVLDLLARNRPALAPAVFATLSVCFGWDELQGDVDAEYVEEVARRCVQVWLLSPDGARTLGTRYIARTESLLMADSSVLRSLRTPRPYWRNLLTALAPTRGAQAVGLLGALEVWDTHDVPAGLDAGQVQFWARFFHPGDRIHLLTGGIRAGLVGVFLGLICLWGVLGSWPMPPSAGGMFSGEQRAALIVTVGTLFVPMLWALGVGWRGLLRWQMAAEGSATVLPALRILTVPLLVAVTAGGLWGVLQNTTGVPWIAVGITVFASGLILHVAAMRYRQRCGEFSPIADDFIGLWLMLAILMIVPAWVTALVLWAMDLHRHRGALRWSNR